MGEHCCLPYKLLALQLFCLKIYFSSISYWIDSCDHAFWNWLKITYFHNKVSSVLGALPPADLPTGVPGPHRRHGPRSHSCPPTLNDLPPPMIKGKKSQHQFSAKLLRYQLIEIANRLLLSVSYRKAWRMRSHWRQKFPQWLGLFEYFVTYPRLVVIQISSMQDSPVPRP